MCFFININKRLFKENYASKGYFDDSSVNFRSRLSENPSTDFRLVWCSGKKTKHRIRSTMVIDDPMYHSLTVVHDLLPLENAVTKNSQFISRLFKYT